MARHKKAETVADEVKEEIMAENEKETPVVAAEDAEEELEYEIKQRLVCKCGANRFQLVQFAKPLLALVKGHEDEGLVQIDDEVEDVYACASCHSQYYLDDLIPKDVPTFAG